MEGKDVVKLAVDLSAGVITQQYISDKYGAGVLSVVLGVAGGAAAGAVANTALDWLDRETGIITDVGGVIDDVFSIFN